MFEHWSYIGYTALFCLPPLVLIWLRREFCEVLLPFRRRILLSTAVLTLYGSLIWPVALRHGCWAYGSDRITNIEVFGYVYLDDVVWWALVSLLFATVVTLCAHYERRGIDIVWREITGLVRSFRNAFRGLRIIPLERNSTIHVAIVVFALLEAVLFRISSTEWMFVGLSMGLVLGFELLNSALERVASLTASRTDAVSGDGGRPLHPEIGLIKDAAAAGVLVSAAAAAGVGVVIFFHRFAAAVF